MGFNEEMSKNIIAGTTLLFVFLFLLIITLVLGIVNGWFGNAFMLGNNQLGV